jgi:myo-inositol-1-phosphate synthase
MARKKLRVALVGVGNCASSFVQGLTHYAEATANAPPPGLMHVDLGGYHVSDIELAAAFDIHAGKVGRDLSEAIVAAPNNTMRFAQPRDLGVTVRRGPTLDGIGKYLAGDIEESDEPVSDVAEELRRSGADILVSYLPVGSQAATEFYAEQALAAGCAFVNCIPVFIGSNPAGRGASSSAACRSSATTSRARSGPPSSTGCWPTCSASAACGSTAPTS